ncbi:MAG: hypothetical protein ABJB66_01750 [Gemmatimonadaceae bacterium]
MTNGADDVGNNWALTLVGACASEQPLNTESSSSTAPLVQR